MPAFSYQMIANMELHKLRPETMGNLRFHSDEEHGGDGPWLRNQLTVR